MDELQARRDFYYVDTTKNESFYKLTTIGRLYKYDFTSYEWIDVTYKIQIDASWKKIIEKEFNNLLLKYIKDNKLTLTNDKEREEKNKKAIEVLKEYKKHSEIENNERYGNIVSYFRDFFCKVYAKDDKENVYRLDQDGMVKINKAIEDLPFAHVIEPKDVMSSIIMHIEHKIELGKRKNVNICEVLCYKDDKDIYGVTEDNRYWYLNQETGEFENILKEEYPENLTLMEDLQANVILQAELRKGYKKQ